MALHSDTATDVATVSNFRDVRVESYELSLKVNFDSKQIQGICILSCVALKQTQKVVLDTHDSVKINRVSVDGGTEVNFSVSPFSGYGSTLLIELGSVREEGSEFKLTIDYTAGSGPGICWLDAVQTAGKKKPYMYTQGQAVMNRSLFPCQDTPAVKAPYSATVQVPEGFTAVMSSNSSSRDGCRFCFEQTVPVPVYLLALAVGDLASAEIGPRSRVYTEPALLETAQSEFKGVVEEFIVTGEKLFGLYVWGRYDILVMPPSFPFGGMENPCLTFVTPCLLVGDKSLTDVVIHEICHSWFGNLVTNATWSDFWLNEGFTMFAQRRIIEKIFGAPYRCLEAQTGRALLRQHMDHTGEDHPLNRLRVIIEPGVDPDDTYNETPYEKGYMFVCYLQKLVGDVDRFDEFLKSYVDKYKFKSVVAEDTLEYFLEYFPDLREQGVDKRPGFEFDKWLNTPGWPAFEPDLSAGRELTLPAEDLAAKWVASTGEAPEGDISSWKTYQLLHFLDTILEQSLTARALNAFVQTYPVIVNSENAEVCLRWSQIVIKNDFQDEFPKVTAFLQRQGKQKYTLPLYKAMMKGSSAAKQLATKIFQSTKDQLHVQVRAYVEKILAGEN